MGRGFLFTNTVIAFTDGSCYPNPNGHGGWAFTCSFKDKSVVRYGYQNRASNNMMELEAIYRCLQYVPAGKKYNYPFTLYTDSQYAKNVLTKWVDGWEESGQWVTSNGSPVKNKKLIKATHRLVLEHSRYRDFKLRWIKGHAGVEENELADRNASFARISRSTNWKPTDNKNESVLLSGSR